MCITVKRKTITIREDQHEWIEDHYLNLSSFIREQLDELIEVYEHETVPFPSDPVMHRVRPCPIRSCIAFVPVRSGHASRSSLSDPVMRRVTVTGLSRGSLSSDPRRLAAVILSSRGHHSVAGGRTLITLQPRESGRLVPYNEDISAAEPFRYILTR